PTPPRELFEEPPGLRLKVTYTAPPPPKTPAQFNPDPGARNARPAAEEPFFKPEFTLGPVFGSEPVPAPLALPRSPLRDTEVVAVPPKSPTGYGSEPVPFALPRAPIRTVALEPKPVEAKPKHGLEPLPRPLDLPRPNARRNLPFHPHFESSGIARDTGLALPPNTVSANDRWRVGFLPWKRYANGSGEDPFYYHQPRLWHPYYQSVLKGDFPVIGQDIFLNVTVNNSTDFNAQSVPTPSGVSAAAPGQYEFFGRSQAMVVQNNTAFSVELFRGETVFKPIEWAIKLTPVYNVNYLHVQETGGVSPDPRGVLGGVGVAGDGDNDPLNISPATVSSAKVDEDVALAGQVGFAPSARILGTKVFVDGIALAYVASTTSLGAVAPLGTFGTNAPGFAPTNSPVGPLPYVPTTLGGVSGEIRQAIIADPSAVALPGGAARLTAAEVTAILTAGANRARTTRAGIRLPRGVPMQVFISVVNNPNAAGSPPVVLGTFCTSPDTTRFSWDVCVQKARTSVFFSSDTRAFTARTVGFMAQGTYPPGIVGTTPGIFLGLQERFSIITPGGSIAAVNTLNGASFTTSTAVNPNLPNGITIFAGSMPLYRNG
ncbi:MAG: hypothetical protein EBY09_18365, partial [Verrucomicrobia bacterium]|nr:hypothetical protein [Verrucomicrobiota bacterium]